MEFVIFYKKIILQCLIWNGLPKPNNGNSDFIFLHIVERAPLYTMRTEKVLTKFIS